MKQLVLAPALWILAACAGGQERPEPPSGAVDPGVHGLATPGDRGPRPAAPAPGAIDGAAALGGIPGALPAIGAAAPGAAPHPNEAAGNVVMTREHCETLGRKFAELTMSQGSSQGGSTSGPTHAEADGVGRTFADKCAHDMVGQTVPLAEYQCMLRARAADELLGCKR